MKKPCILFDRCLTGVPFFGSNSRKHHEIQLIVNLFLLDWCLIEPRSRRGTGPVFTVRQSSAFGSVACEGLG